MNSLNLPPRLKAPTAFPDDLRVWLGQDCLYAVVLQAVTGLDETDGPLRGMRSLAGEPSQAALLALLTYAYVTQRYASEEVVEDLDHDPALCRLSARGLVDAGLLRRFRRGRRGPLGVALLRVLYLAVEERRAEHGHNTDDHAEWVRLCAEQAERLLDRATLADTVALDT
jgi:hypothetical protein